MAGCSVCTSTVLQGFIGAERCENSMNRRPGQVCVFSPGFAISHGGTVSFVAVNNAAWFPRFAKGLSMGHALR